MKLTYENNLKVFSEKIKIKIKKNCLIYDGDLIEIPQGIFMPTIIYG